MRPYAIRALHGRNVWPQLDMFRTSYHIDLDVLADNLERCFVVDTSCPVCDVLRDGPIVKGRGNVPFTGFVWAPFHSCAEIAKVVADAHCLPAPVDVYEIDLKVLAGAYRSNVYNRKNSGSKVKINLDSGSS